MTKPGRQRVPGSGYLTVWPHCLGISGVLLLTAVSLSHWMMRCQPQACNLSVNQAEVRLHLRVLLLFLTAHGRFFSAVMGHAQLVFRTFHAPVLCVQRLVTCFWLCSLVSINAA